MPTCRSRPCAARCWRRLPTPVVAASDRGLPCWPPMSRDTHLARVRARARARGASHSRTRTDGSFRGFQPAMRRARRSGAPTQGETSSCGTSATTDDGLDVGRAVALSIQSRSLTHTSISSCAFSRDRNFPSRASRYRCSREPISRTASLNGSHLPESPLAEAVPCPIRDGAMVHHFVPSGVAAAGGPGRDSSGAPRGSRHWASRRSPRLRRPVKADCC